MKKVEIVKPSIAYVYEVGHRAVSSSKGPVRREQTDGAERLLLNDTDKGVLRRKGVRLKCQS
jgi:hypothetical protein